MTSRNVANTDEQSGVRNLERQIGKIVRAKAVEYAHALARQQLASQSSASADTATAAAPYASPPPTYNPEVTLADIIRILGHAQFVREPPAVDPPPGVVHGLGYRGSGMGSILTLEAVRLPLPGGARGTLKCTGRLGEVIQESAQLALSCVKGRAVAMGLGENGDGDVMKGYDVHVSGDSAPIATSSVLTRQLHLPSGAVHKDGPSAGVGMVVAFTSLFSQRPVPHTTAFTGEVTLRGAVTAVGGIREKVLAAHRAGMTRIVMPRRNEKDVLADVSDEVRAEIDFRYVGTIEEALEVVWGSEVWKSGERAKVDARL